MTKTLVDGITEWLHDGGYPLELYAAKKLRELGFRCSKSPFFSDSESEKPREVDIVASIYTENRFKQHLELKLVIECKKSSNAFVVLCDVPDEKTLLKGVVFGNLWVGQRDNTFVFFSYGQRRFFFQNLCYTSPESSY